MKKQVWQGSWRTLLIRLFVGAFLPALATYLALNFLLSLRMTSSGASWTALFIAVGIWNFCNYLMGHTIPHNNSLGLDDEGWLDKYKPYEPCRFNDDYAKIRPLSSQGYRSPADPVHPNNWSNPYNPSSFTHHH